MRVKTLFTIPAFTSDFTANAANYYFSNSQGDDSRSSSLAKNLSNPRRSISKFNSPGFQTCSPVIMFTSSIEKTIMALL